MPEHTVLRLAVCIYPDVCSLDFVGPMELFSFLFPQALATRPYGVISPYAIQVSYMSVSRDPVVSTTGTVVLPSISYQEVSEQFDILLVPGCEYLFRSWGFQSVMTLLTLASKKEYPQALIEFVKAQAPGAKYVLSVCTGSEVLALAGVLGRRRATTNKASFRRIVAETSELGIYWVPKARWVVDGNIWTSSGVTAGKF